MSKESLVKSRQVLQRGKVLQREHDVWGWGCSRDRVKSVLMDGWQELAWSTKGGDAGRTRLPRKRPSRPLKTKA